MQPHVTPYFDSISAEDVKLFLADVQITSFNF